MSRPIHHGRVVYADWLRGSGLLLIIDHGDGYMSLYAHNQSLLREVGEWVTAGTPVSTVGNSGGQEQAALYFGNTPRQTGEPGGLVPGLSGSARPGTGTFISRPQWVTLALPCHLLSA